VIVALAAAAVQRLDDLMGPLFDLWRRESAAHLPRRPGADARAL